MRLLEQTSVLCELEIEALSLLASADVEDNDREDAFRKLQKSDKLNFAVENYRQLPLIIRARIENWSIDRGELKLGERVTTGAASSSCDGDSVYHATYRHFDVAVKVTEGDLLSDAPRRRRVQAELAALALIRHPNVAMFIGACIEPRCCLIACEPPHGGNLEDFLLSRSRASAAADGGRKVGWLPASSAAGRRAGRRRQTVAWALDLLRAVNHLHQSDPRVVHRDIRPANLLLSASGGLKLAAFAASRVLPSSPAPAAPRRPHGCGRELAGEDEDGGGRGPQPEGRRRRIIMSPDGRWRRPSDRLPCCRDATASAAAGCTGDDDDASDGAEGDDEEDEAAAAERVPITRFTAPELHPTRRAAAAAAAAAAASASSSPCSGPSVCVAAGGGGGGGGGGGEEEKADVYSAALVIWTLHAGHPPHPHLGDAAAAAAAADPAARLRPCGAALGWAGLAAALEGAWGDAPGGRPGADALLESLEGLREEVLLRHRRGCGSSSCAGPAAAAAAAACGVQ
jgi:serine/threonine protein kinase